MDLTMNQIIAHSFIGDGLRQGFSLYSFFARTNHPGRASRRGFFWQLA
jgi:hypothetical protein